MPLIPHRTALNVLLLFFLTLTLVILFRGPIMEPVLHRRTLHRPLAASTAPIPSNETSVIPAPTIGQQPSRNNSFAYVFYATDARNACNALIAHTQLLSLNKSALVDTLVLVTQHLPVASLAKLRQAGVKVKHVELWQQTHGERTWANSLTKLHIFSDLGYKRIVYLDSDSLVLKNLDHLFALPDASMWLPRAYWLTQPFLASSLIVTQPSSDVMRDIRGAISKPDTGFDMDVLNSLYKNTAGVLPNPYVILNSDLRRPASPSIDDLYTSTHVVHFSCGWRGEYSKPWQIEQRQRAGEPTEWHHGFYAAFERFWALERQVC